MISFACFSPHPPLLLPEVGSQEDKRKVGKTIAALNELGKKREKSGVEKIVVASPHRKWGFEVPLHFLASGFEGEVEKLLVVSDSARDNFKKGKSFAGEIKGDAKWGLIGSGDLSHKLKKEGPYGFHPQGPKFDETFREALKEKNVERIMGLKNEFPKAADCGLLPFSFVLGVLEEKEVNWKPEILSYEGPFGVGYLVADLIGTRTK